MKTNKIYLIIIPFVLLFLSWVIPVRGEYGVLEGKYWKSETNLVYVHTECDWVTKQDGSNRERVWECETVRDVVASSSKAGKYPEVVTYPPEPKTLLYYNDVDYYVGYYHTYKIDEEAVERESAVSRITYGRYYPGDQCKVISNIWGYVIYERC